MDEAIIESADCGAFDDSECTRARSQPLNHPPTQRLCLASSGLWRKRVNFTLFGIGQMSHAHVLHTQFGARIAGVFPALEALGQLIHILGHLNLKRDQLVSPASALFAPPLTREPHYRAAIGP